MKKNLYVILIILTVLFYTGCPGPGSETAPPTTDNNDADTKITPPELVNVSAGTFPMGNPDTGSHYSEYPVHSVTLDEYEIGKYEVTNAQFAEVLNWALDKGYISVIDNDRSAQYQGTEVYDLDAGYVPIQFAGGIFSVIEAARENHPASSIIWYGAVAYCNWLSEANGLDVCYDLSTWTQTDKNAGGFRLPSEAEWERAAAWKAETSTYYKYPNSSNTLTTTIANYENINPYSFTDIPYTVEIGYYTDQLSPAGCYNMSGNVAELVYDWYDPDYYTADAVTNPFGPSGPVPYQNTKVYRGGSYSTFDTYCTTSARWAIGPTGVSQSVGFRIAR